MSLVHSFRALRSVSVTTRAPGKDQSAVVAAVKCLSSLPSLEEFDLRAECDLDASLLEALGNLENNAQLTSFKLFGIDSEEAVDWEGFRKDFCGRFLSKNRLKKLFLDSFDLQGSGSAMSIWDRVGDNNEALKAFVDAHMTNLEELGAVIPSRVVSSGSFPNLRKVAIEVYRDKEVADVCISCRLIEEFFVSERDL